MVWVYRLAPEFIEKLEERDLVALILLAHFGILLRTLETGKYWFIQGWSCHILSNVRKMLAPEFRQWVPLS